jgi:hypothetical protein
MPFDLLRGESNHSLEMPQVSFLEQLVAKHGAERWCQRHRQPEGDAVIR